MKYHCNAYGIPYSVIDGALIGCRSKPAKNAFLQLPHGRMERMVDSVFRHDTRNLHRFAASDRDDRYWNVFEVDPYLSADTAYQWMNRNEEPHLNPFKEKDDRSLPARRSSKIDHYITVRNYFEGKEHYFQNNIGANSNCQAYLEDDTLRIQIGAWYGLGGEGFFIYQSGARFLSMPYYYDDVIDYREPEPRNIPLWQKLVLDKATYSIGDSLYGYISFGSVFYNKYGTPSGNKANGFFRTVIKKRDW
ncbi:hypothetical protein [Niabella sp.]|uniref:hypothetical protein n=1 Tax=Niabella sp. TaxID=1962976 RepID=UPI002625F3BD|nr:hypothetical protein [Niabella sp.]